LKIKGEVERKWKNTNKGTLFYKKEKIEKQTLLVLDLKILCPK